MGNLGRTGQGAALLLRIDEKIDLAGRLSLYSLYSIALAKLALDPYLAVFLAPGTYPVLYDVCWDYSSGKQLHRGFLIHGWNSLCV
jgi:hypothetical protein